MADPWKLDAPPLDDESLPGYPDALHLELEIQDPDIVAALAAVPPGEARLEFALAALKIGVLALAQARGQLDGETVRRESQRMLDRLAQELGQHAQLLQQRLTSTLREYFDPQSGRFEERIQRLVQRDGELESVLRRQVGGNDSELTRTLTAHFGESSPLMKLLAPDASQGLLVALRETLGEQLGHQRNQVLAEFSLDRPESALSRLVGELTKSQGQLTGQLQGKIDTVVAEFSLDKEDSALSRLVRNVDRAQRTITAEFSLDSEQSALSRLKQVLDDTHKAIHDHLTLDNEQSALARLKRELLSLLDQQTEHNQKFQEEVKVTLGQMVARRQEAARSTRHGHTFEQAVFEFLQHQAQAAGDVARFVGDTTGLIRNCKVGDCQLELGPDNAAAGATLVIEAKQAAGYDLAKARAELEEARKNRGAQVGLFVFSRQSAPAALEPVARYGSDVVVIWDAEDPQTDLAFKAGLAIAKALCMRAASARHAQTADFDTLEKAVLEVERQAGSLDEIVRSTETIRSAGDKILKRVEIAKRALERQVETLSETLASLKTQWAGTSDG